MNRSSFHGKEEQSLKGFISILISIPVLAWTKGQILKPHVGTGALLPFHFGNHFDSKHQQMCEVKCRNYESYQILKNKISSKFNLKIKR